MGLDKLELIKKVIEKQLNTFDFDAEIDRNQKMLDYFRETPADECVFSGNIEHGIINLVSNATGVTYPMAYLSARKHALQDFLKLLDKEIKELEDDLKPIVHVEKESRFTDDFLEKLKTRDGGKEQKKHFYDCKLTDEDWGSEHCICPGAYIYKKYLSIGLSKEEAKLISDYRELDDLMEDKEKYAKGKALYEKHKFLNVSQLSK